MQARDLLVRPADERQRAIREHAHAVSYRILGHAWLPSTNIEQLELLAGFALVFITFPAAVIAWSEPDPVADDPM